MSQVTITEALAELKTIDKRVQKKREFILSFLLRQEMMKDPLQADGGAVSAIKREQQSIGDLLERKVAIRRAIQTANAVMFVVIGNDKRTIADWLVWRRDVAPLKQQFFNELRGRIEATRQEAQRKGVQVVNGEAQKPTDIIVNVNEQELAKQIEAMEETLGVLDGQLSLKNATMTIDV